MTDNSEKLANLNKEQSGLRLEFIEMMFALAIAQVGIEVGDFFYNDLNLIDHLYVITHLTLVTYIISSSWIGWQRSKSRGTKIALDSFSVSFFILLLDLFLVICYFIIVRGVERPTNGETIPSADIEVWWSLIIFFTYFVWDIITKLIYVDLNKMTCKFDFPTFYKRGFQSLCCAIFILVFITPLLKDPTVNSVISIDISLILVFILFRSLKSEYIFKEGNKRSKIIRIFFFVGIPIISIVSLLYFKIIDYIL